MAQSIRRRSFFSKCYPFYGRKRWVHAATLGLPLSRANPQTLFDFHLIHIAQCKRGDGEHTHRTKFRDACDVYSEFRKKIRAHKSSWKQSSSELDLTDELKLRIIATYNPKFIRHMKLSNTGSFTMKTKGKLPSESTLGLTVEYTLPAGHGLLSPLPLPLLFSSPPSPPRSPVPSSVCLLLLLPRLPPYPPPSPCGLFTSLIWSSVAHTSWHSQDERGWNIIHHLAYSNSEQLLSGILALDMNNKREELPPTKLIKQKGGDMKGSYHKWLTARDKCGYQPIHIAAQFGSLQFFETLWRLTYPWNLNAKHLKNCNGRDKEEIIGINAFDNCTSDGLFSSPSLFSSLLWSFGGQTASRHSKVRESWAAWSHSFVNLVHFPHGVGILLKLRLSGNSQRLFVR